MKTSPEEKSMSILNTIIATFANYLKNSIDKIENRDYSKTHKQLS